MKPPDRLQRVEELFHAALEREPSERAAFLAAACASDAALLAEVAALLAAHEQPGSFLDAPAFQVQAGSLADAPAQSLVGRVIGRYQVLAPLGRGGMGEVYLAQDTQLNRKAALKLLPARFTADADRVRRFKQEAQAASALNHPNIITIYEIGQVSGTHFIAAEFVQGQTLRHRIRGERMALAEALAVAGQVANALEAAHAAGIIHRDIKPENIMLRPDGYIKVLDFGLAKLIEPRPAGRPVDSEAPTSVPTETTPGMILGTLSYLSPEQARGRKVDGRTDLWSLGVVLYEMVTGQPPFAGESGSDILVSILDREPPLAQSLAQAPAELVRIVTKTLAKNREERYQTAKDLAIDLKRLERQLEVEAELARAHLPERGSTAAEPRPGEQRERNLAAPQATEQSRKPATFRLLIAVAALLIVAVIGLLAWSILRSKPPEPASPAGPERLLSYSLTVQKMRDGEPYQAPFESSGQEIFENGWKFRLSLSSPQAGFLYLLNEGPASGGVISLHLLFPTPSTDSLAQLAAHQVIQTGWYVFDEHQGTEKFWLVWAARPVSELEAVKGAANPRDKGAISDPSQLSAVRALLATHAAAKPEVEKDRFKKQTNVRGRGEVLVHLAELEHH